MKKLTQYALILCILHLAAPTALYADAAACSKTSAAVSDSSPDSEAEQPTTLTTRIKEYWKVCVGVGVVAACAAVYYFTQPAKKARGGGGIQFKKPKPKKIHYFYCTQCEQQFKWDEETNPYLFFRTEIRPGKFTFVCRNNPTCGVNTKGKERIKNEHIFDAWEDSDVDTEEDSDLD